MYVSIYICCVHVYKYIHARTQVAPEVHQGLRFQILRVRICLCMYFCLYINILCVYVYIYIYIYIYTYMYTDIVSTGVHVPRSEVPELRSEKICVCICVCVLRHTYVRCIYVRMCTRTYLATEVYQGVTPVAGSNSLGEKVFILWTFPEKSQISGHLFYCVHSLGLWTGFIKAPNIWTALLKKKRTRKIPRGWSVLNCREFEWIIRWNKFCPFHEITCFTLKK